jgi:hypothetical protein
MHLAPTQGVALPLFLSPKLASHETTFTRKGKARNYVSSTGDVNSSLTMLNYFSQQKSPFYYIIAMQHNWLPAFIN